MIWVKMLKQKNIGGKHYRPGQWVEVGQQYAAQLVASNQAIALYYDEILPADTLGVISPHKNEIFSKISRLPVTNCKREDTPYETTLWLGRDYRDIDQLPAMLVNPGKLRAAVDAVQNGAWDIAVPMRAFHRLALHVATEAQESALKAQIRDLRTPTYEASLIVYKSAIAPFFVDVKRFTEEIKSEELGFLMAYYEHKPLLWALPPSWAD